MIYPSNFETKIGFDDIRQLLKQRCLSPLGKEAVDGVCFSGDSSQVNQWLRQVREFRIVQEKEDSLPLSYFFDMREAISRLRLEGTHIEEHELYDLRRSMETICGVLAVFNRGEGNDDGGMLYDYPSLHDMAEGVMGFPQIVRRIDQILDKFGKVKDSASAALSEIRHQLAKTEGSISRTLYSILRAAQSEGLVDKDVTPTLRDGRLVIPVAPTLKRRIKGIVHDESATGKTVYVEPAEVVEANNRVRELEAEERREVIRILTEVSAEIRPYVPQLLESYRFLGAVDLLRAKVELAKTIGGIEPRVERYPLIDWTHAVHPLLQMSLAKHSKKVVPLDIQLTREKRILLISGPNAGGKSVCLKTVGLLQYMLQCGLSIPVSERSRTGVFDNVMIDIGDEQSIEDDLSTYSSHLFNMKNMMRQANDRTILLIDEFGGGTEPQIGGAIAEAVLKQFCGKKTYGVITTHYQNLKHFADDHEGVVNGAMLYDRHEMRALFQLAIGRPGSSFAIEIARKTGIPEEVIRDASEIVGSDYIQSDKYLLDIVRDKRYWEGKRQTIHQHEKQLEQRIAHMEKEIEDIERQRKEILRKAKQQAEELLGESNKKIENAIREIRENQAAKEETKRIREELNAFRQEVDDIDTKATDEIIQRKMEKIRRRQERKKAQPPSNLPQGGGSPADGVSGDVSLSRKGNSVLDIKIDQLTVGSTVRIKGLSSVGRIEYIDGKMATVIFGDMRTKMRIDRLEGATPQPSGGAGGAGEHKHADLAAQQSSRMTRETIDAHKVNFRQDIDVRGMRGDEALNAVMHYIDDAILMGASRVRILHGTGTGALRQLIRQYLSTVPNVTSYRDEHVQFGGAGITVVEM
ncbi:MAG: Smr/MutS family protein [Prevotella sp.]|nr:Smr/MutS family protein [Prevotella sp.]